MKKVISLLLFFIVCISWANAQARGDLKMAIIDLIDNFNSYDTNKRTCNNDAFSAQANTVIELVTELEDKWVVKAYRAFVNRDDNDNQIQKSSAITYCIDKNDLNDFFINFSKTDYGILAIPFKVRFAPFKIFPGGTIGGYIGRKFVQQRSSSTLLGFAGLSSIPLNDVNSDVIDTQLGITVGTGYVWYVVEGFQIGLITGVDLFDGVNDWPYKYQPWLSFNIGYTFTSQSRKQQEKVLEIQRR